MGHVITSATTITVVLTQLPHPSRVIRISRLSIGVGALDTRIVNVEKDVKVLNTQMMVLQEMSYGLMRASTGLMSAYENLKKCREASSDC